MPILQNGPKKKTRQSVCNFITLIINSAASVAELGHGGEVNAGCCDSHLVTDAKMSRQWCKAECTLIDYLHPIRIKCVVITVRSYYYSNQTEKYKHFP